jgi:hypothetical protein
MDAFDALKALRNAMDAYYANKNGDEFRAACRLLDKAIADADAVIASGSDDFQLALSKLVRAHAHYEEANAPSLRVRALRIIADRLEAESGEGGDRYYHFNEAARKWVLNVPVRESPGIVEEPASEARAA